MALQIPTAVAWALDKPRQHVRQARRQSSNPDRSVPRRQGVVCGTGLLIGAVLALLLTYAYDSYRDLRPAGTRVQSAALRQIQLAQWRARMEAEAKARREAAARLEKEIEESYTNKLVIEEDDSPEVPWHHQPIGFTTAAPAQKNNGSSWNCTAPKGDLLPTNMSDLGPYVSGGPVWPAGSASSYPWDRAEGKLYELPERRQGLQESIWALPNRTKPCGSPCVAHCIAGQPRDILMMPGLWKSYRHRFFDRFSESPVIFAVYSASAFWNHGAKTGDGDHGHVRTNVTVAPDDAMVRGFKYMRVDRALVLREPCTTGKCMQAGAGLSCAAKPLGLTTQYDKKTGNVTVFCDVQVRRLQTCMHLVREYEQDHETSFAWVVRDRPDVYFAEPAASHIKLRLDTVYVKHYGACGYGGMDWLYFMPRHHADTIARFPDEMKCDYLKHKHVQPVCAHCIGCECFLAAWMYSQKIQFQPVPLPWDGFIPVKFCGGGCPYDWKVTRRSICRGLCTSRDKMPDARCKRT